MANRLHALVIVGVFGLIVHVQAASPWTPADTNTWGWYDPSEAANMTTNASGGVTQLFDLSGAGKHVSANTGEEPTAFTRLLGSRYGLDFVSSEGDVLIDTGGSGLGSNGVVSFYAVYDRDFAAQHNPPFLNYQDDFNFNIGSLNPYDKRNPSNGGLSYSGGPYTNTHIFSAHLVFDASTNLPLSYFNAYVDGVKVTADKAYISQLPTSPPRFSIMSANNPDISADGVIGEILIVNDATDTSRQIIEGYLAHRWGLVGNLPEGHPYIKRPPGLGPPGTVITLY